MNYDLKDTVAIVTAGTQGIGRAIVSLLIEQGALVATCARNEERLAELEKRYPGRIFTQHADLGNAKSLLVFIDAALSKFGRCDHLFSNAPKPARGLLSELTMQDWQSSFDGLIGSLATASSAVLPKMKERKSGSVVLLSSLTAVEPIDRLAASSVLRGGLRSWVRLMARECGLFNVRVNAVLTGYTKTPLTQTEAEKEAKEREVAIEEIFRQRSESHALRRMAKPEEIAHAALFLASPGASYITGTSLLVDGGATRVV